MHFDSAEMRFLCGDIRCSLSKDTDGSWLSVRRAGKKKMEYFENINECLHFNQSWVLAGPRGFTRRLSQIHFQRCFVLFFLIDQLRLKMITSCKFLTSLFQNICPKLKIPTGNLIVKTHLVAATLYCHISIHRNVLKYSYPRCTVVANS